MNIQKLMKQAQEMQKKMGQMQEELASKEITGNAGGGMVSITMNGKNELLKIALDPSLLNADEKDMLEDLIVAAHNDARKKVEQATEEAMRDAAGGMNLPAGMKLPF